MEWICFKKDIRMKYPSGLLYLYKMLLIMLEGVKGERGRGRGKGTKRKEVPG